MITSSLKEQLVTPILVTPSSRVFMSRSLKTSTLDLAAGSVSIPRTVSNPISGGQARAGS